MKFHSDEGGRRQLGQLEKKVDRINYYSHATSKKSLPRLAETAQERKGNINMTHCRLDGMSLSRCSKNFDKRIPVKFCDRLNYFHDIWSNFCLEVLNPKFPLILLPVLFDLYTCFDFADSLTCEQCLSFIILRMQSDRSSDKQHFCPHNKKQIKWPWFIQTYTFTRSRFDEEKSLLAIYQA